MPKGCRPPAGCGSAAREQLGGGVEVDAAGAERRDVARRTFGPPAGEARLDDDGAGMAREQLACGGLLLGAPAGVAEDEDEPAPVGVGRVEGRIRPDAASGVAEAVADATGRDRRLCVELDDERDVDVDVALGEEYLANLHARLGATTVYVTHDQVEAQTLGQRVAVMRDGRVQQVASPHELYTRPANLFVAAFIGSPAMNLAHARLDGDRVELAGFRIPLDRDRRPAAAPGELVVGVRPDAFEDAAFADPSLPQIDVTPTVLEELGSDIHVIFRVDAAPVLVDDVLQASDDEDSALLGDDDVFFNARVDQRSTARVGVPMRLAIDPARLHFFDAATGENVAAATPRTAAAATAQ